ncbi:MAG: SAM-dependent methyltransferase [Desulfuromonadales bacterium GWD2_61_12]|nr:MAG: SAM-dependent methyltransferase [Desulfuromonadales bacterium GWC2_61_20]OGR34144.1 MAG: SAM-dependent methyltransferase [Desulfuromonadales bacterium GWD2_61_12]HAD03457.1 SAM-dependent methyltransferase [Desulfuromonas sp.]HBT83454.1 SAM-dependent methyltransferase [Desulfuromonas sp.]
MARNFKDKVREQFGRTADGYVRNRGFAQGDDLVEAARLLKPSPEDVLLDVACGGGHTALYFSPLVRSVVASDLTMQMLKKAQEFISEEGGVENVTFREADAEDLPFPSGSFTMLTCRIAPHHFPDVPRALREFHRVLRRKEGRMVIIDTLLPDEEKIAQFYQEAEQMRDPTHVRAYTKAQWTTMIEDAGFDVQQTKTFPKTHEFQEWARRTGLNREGVQRLNRFFIEATPDIADYFQIETFAGEVESYTDRKLLVYATRRDVK